MLKRTITGAAIVAVAVGFFFLRLLDVRYFNILIAIFALLGTGEVLYALKKFAFKAKPDENGKFKPTGWDIAAITAVMSVAAAIVPLFTFVGWIAAVAALVTGILLTAVIKACSFNSYGREYAALLLAVLYPNALLLALLFANGMQNGTLALVMIFVISPCADVFAYLVGSLIGGKKLCPKVSPHKTVSGAIGGLLGGAVGGMVLYFIFRPVTAFAVPWLIFLIIGFVGAFFTETGDLFESYIKRRCGVKDMGKLLPGHGGIMDRIDGMLFAGVFITLVFLAV